MAQQTNSKMVTSNTRAALLGFGLTILLGGLTQAAWQQSEFSCTALKLALGTLSYLGLAAWQTLHAHPCVQWILEALLQASGALCSLFAHVAGAAL